MMWQILNEIRPLESCVGWKERERDTLRKVCFVTFQPLFQLKSNPLFLFLPNTHSHTMN